MANEVKIHEFQVSQADKLLAGGAIVAEGSAFAGLNLVPIIATKPFEQNGSDWSIYFGQYGNGGGLQYTSAEYEALFESPTELDTPDAMKAFFGNSAIIVTKVNDIGDSAEFNSVVNFGGSDFVFLTGTPMLSNDTIHQWFLDHMTDWNIFV